MEDHGVFSLCSFILGSTGFLLVPSDAQENGKTENVPLSLYVGTPRLYSSLEEML